MKKAKNVKVGDVIQFPYYCFDERRKGWNGWIFRAGIVDGFGVSNSGVKFAKVRYCSKIAGRYKLLPCEESTRNIKVEYLFFYDTEFQARSVRQFLEYEKNGEQVCWSEDSALLVNNGLI